MAGCFAMITKEKVQMGEKKCWNVFIRIMM